MVTPGPALPTVPILSARNGQLRVEKAWFSVMPQASVISMPMRWYHSSKAGATGAEPQPSTRA
ncbi:hypothetical protein D3C79_967590 [compost metagenome]